MNTPRAITVIELPAPHKEVGKVPQRCENGCDFESPTLVDGRFKCPICHCEYTAEYAHYIDVDD